ncbi:MAG: hypothetical protein UE295_02340 [Acutalibacteraceae bacterium]|nr:hypothetical protein [Acutalibacteraceae bacterium]
MKDKMKKFIKRLPQEVSHIFSIMMVVFLVSALMNGVENISVYKIAQLFAIAVLGGMLLLIAFSDIFIKKVLYIVRICIFIVPFFFVTLIFALTFSWFKSLNIITWVWFIGIFLFCFALSVVIYLVTTKIKGKEYTEKLIEYQNKNKDDVTMY